MSESTVLNCVEKIGSTLPTAATEKESVKNDICVENAFPVIQNEAKMTLGTGNKDLINGLDSVSSLENGSKEIVSDGERVSKDCEIISDDSEKSSKYCNDIIIMPSNNSTKDVEIVQNGEQVSSDDLSSSDSSITKTTKSNIDSLKKCSLPESIVSTNTLTDCSSPRSSMNDSEISTKTKSNSLEIANDSSPSDSLNTIDNRQCADNGSDLKTGEQAETEPKTSILRDNTDETESKLSPVAASPKDANFIEDLSEQEKEERDIDIFIDEENQVKDIDKSESQSRPAKVNEMVQDSLKSNSDMFREDSCEATKDSGECGSVASLEDISETANDSVNEICVASIDSQKETQMEGEEKDEPMETERPTLSEDLPTAKRQVDDREDGESLPMDSDLINSHEKMEFDNQKEFNNKSTMSPVYVNLENDAKSMDDEDGNEIKETESLKISKVMTCSGIDEESQNCGTDVCAQDADIKSEDMKKVSDNTTDIEESKENEKLATDGQNSSDSQSQDSSKLTESSGNIKTDKKVVKTESEHKNDVLSTGSNSTERVSFKNILKKDLSQTKKLSDDTPTPKDEKTVPDETEAIVIDESETVAENSNNVSESKEHLETLKAEKVTSKSETPERSKDVKDENSSNSSVDQQSKKRALSPLTEDSKLSPPKRQRLDSVINKLGDHVGVKPSEATTVIMDSDDDADSAPLPSTSAKTAKEDKMDKDDGTLKLSSQMLRSLIKASLKSFMKTQKLEKEHQIDERMRKMEAATDLWRETAKHLEKSVNELTSYTKELNKRKSQAVKLKHLSNRTVAIQVSLPHQQNQAKATPNQPTTTTTTSANRSTSLSLPPSVLRHPTPAHPTNRPVPQVVTNGNIRPNQAVSSPRQQVRNMGLRGSSPMPSVPQSMNRQRVPGLHQTSPQAQPQSLPFTQHHNQSMKATVHSPLAQHSGRLGPRPGNAPLTRPPISHQAPAASNLIDLTDEDDGVKQSTPSVMPSSRTQKTPHTGAPGPNSVISSNRQNIQQDGLGSKDLHKNIISSRGASSFTHIDSSNSNSVRNGSSASLSSKSNMAASRTPGNDAGAKVSGSTGTSPSSSRTLPPSVYVSQPTKHPAALPVEPFSKIVNTTQILPPKPSLKISRVAQGIVLSWNMPTLPSNVANIASYQLFAYQETNSPPSSALWKKVGDVKALPLPMACTLVQFQEGNKYYFAVRAVDVFGRWGEYSDPSSIYLYPNPK